MRSVLLVSAPFVSALAGLLADVSVARATVHVAIDLTNQTMHVDSSSGSYDWPISSARSGFYTPGGSFAPTHMELMHYSKKYHMSPMPHAIFFRGGYAIHGTYETGSLGRPASHGCVRLSPGHATELYEMVKEEGARISISGTPPASRSIYARSRAAPADVASYGYDEERPRAPRRTYYYQGMAGGYGYGYSYTLPSRPYPSAYSYAPGWDASAATGDLFLGQ